MKEKNKKFLNLDKYYRETEDLINKSSLKEIKKIREDLKIEKGSLDIVIKKDDISDGLRKFLKGKRKFITQLLSYSKRRIALLNKITNHSSEKKLTEIFFKIASEELSSEIFQLILGKSLTMMELEKEYHKDIINEYFKDIKENQEDFNIE